MRRQRWHRSDSAVRTTEGGDKAGKMQALRQKVPYIRDNTGVDIYEPSKE